LGSRLLLLGHRGARLYAPENTLAAFDLALEHGAHGFEFDVRRTRDGKTVLCHDRRVNRVSLRRHTLKQLQERGGFQEVAGLEDALARYGHTAFLNIEVKVRGLEPLIVQTVRQAQLNHYFISSFLPDVVYKLHYLDRTLVLGTLAKTRWQLRRWPLLPVAYVVPHYSLLSQELVDTLHAAGKLVVTWTVNESAQMLRVAAMGVDGVISDDTRLLVETLGPVRQAG
jgi:glycerophosphoryl diester phosphodiesterase